MSSGPESRAAAAGAAKTTQELDLLESILQRDMKARDDETRATAETALKRFVDDVMERLPTAKVAGGSHAILTKRIAELDRLLSAQVNAILHHPEFQKLEASWRGLKYLVSESETDNTLKIRMLDASKEELLKDFSRAVEFDQSALFKKIYEEEFGTYGGDPFGALIGDYEFSRSNQDVELLRHMSKVAASAHAPFISAASAKMFDWDSFAELPIPRDVEKIFSGADSVKWQSFRETEDSRYVALTLPHILIREPYTKGDHRVETFVFEEDVDGTDHSKYLWSNAAYAFGTRLTEAFARYGWCAAIRGEENGGKVSNLPVHNFLTEEGGKAMKCPTEINITDRREAELSKAGFIPLVHKKNSDFAVFFGAQSCHKPPKYNTDDAKANAALGARIPYIMATSRIAHYLKAIGRAKIGSFTSQAELQRYLNDWIQDYVLSIDTADDEQKARRPLRAAEIRVVEVAGKPGSYEAVAYLQPHYQLEELTVSLRLVAKIPEAKQ